MKKSEIKSLLSQLAVSDGTTKILDKTSVADLMFNAESLDSTSKSLAEQNLQTLEHDIKDVLSKLNLESYGTDSQPVFTDNQVKAAVLASTMTLKPDLYGSRLRDSFKALNSGGSGVTVTNLEDISSGINLDGEELIGTMNLESFDGQNLKAVNYITIALAAATAKQDDFAEMFFPLIVMGPADAFYEMKIEIDNLIKDYRHITADGMKFRENKKVLLKSLYDNDLLNENRLAIMPFKDNDPAGDVLLIGAEYGTEVNDEEFTTAPYKFNKSIDIFAVTNTAGEAAKGNIPDFTDALDRSIALTNLYVGFGDAADNHFAKFNLDFMPRRHFNIPPEGHNKELIVNFNGRLAINSKNTKDFKNDASGTDYLMGDTIGAGDEYNIVIDVTVNGSVRTDTSIIKLTHSAIELVSVKRASDNVAITDFENGIGADIAAQVATFKLAGYDLDVSVTNSNFRKRSIMLQSESETFRFPCRFKSGINVYKPVFNIMGEDNDAMAATIEKQALAVSAIASVGAVNTLIKFADKLNDLNNNGVLQSSTMFTKTPAMYAVQPWQHREAMSVQSIVDSLESSDKRENIAAAITNKIADTVTTMGIESNYFNVYEKLYPGKRKTVVIGTDPYIASYLGKQLQTSVNATVTSNTFSLTHDTDAVIVSTANPLMAGKLMVTFTVIDNPNRNTNADILSFGYGLYTPPFNREVQVTKSNSTFKELHVNPRFDHIPNLPILAEFHIDGIKEAIKKNVFNTKDV